jgi:hypothetical protein
MKCEKTGREGKKKSNESMYSREREKGEKVRKNNPQLLPSIVLIP